MFFVIVCAVWFLICSTGLVIGPTIIDQSEANEAAANLTYVDAYRYHYKQGLASADAWRKAKEDVAEFIEGRKPYSAAAVDSLKLEYPKYFCEAQE
jgi:hypothetical protein